MVSLSTGNDIYMKLVYYEHVFDSMRLKCCLISFCLFMCLFVWVFFSVFLVRERLFYFCWCTTCMLFSLMK